MEPKKSVDKLLSKRHESLANHAKSDIEIERLIGRQAIALSQSDTPFTLDTLIALLQPELQSNELSKLTAQYALKKISQ